MDWIEFAKQFQRVPEYGFILAILWVIYKALDAVGLIEHLRLKLLPEGQPSTQLSGEHSGRLVETLVTVQEALVDFGKRLGVIEEIIGPKNGSTLMDNIHDIVEAVQRTDGKIEAHLSANAMALFRTDKDGLWQWVNASFLQMVGRVDGRTLMNRGWHICLDEKNKERTITAYQAAVQTSSSFEQEVLFRTPDGRRVLAFMVVEPSTHKKEQVHAFFGHCRIMRDETSEG